MSEFSDAIDHARRAWATSDHDLDRLRADAAAAPPARSLTEVLSEDALALIVEPKRATAARGVINDVLDIATICRECQAGGAGAVSIVTEPRLSRGSHDDVRAARAACDLPIIARDFIVDACQVYALRSAGADVLMTSARLYMGREPELGELDDPQSPPTDTLRGIVAVAHQLGMEVVLSIQGDDELAFALESEVDVLNVDNRGDDDRVDVDRTFELLADVPVGWPVISESIAAVDQVARLHRAGVDALLLDEGHVEGGLAHALAVYADVAHDA